MGLKRNHKYPYELEKRSDYRTREGDEGSGDWSIVLLRWRKGPQIKEYSY